MDDTGIVDGDVCADGVRRPSIRLRGGGGTESKQQGLFSMWERLSRTRALFLCQVVSLSRPSWSGRSCRSVLVSSCSRRTR